MSMSVHVLVPITGVDTSNECYESPAPGLVLIALVRAGVNATLITLPSPGEKPLLLVGGSSSSKITAAVAALSFSEGIVPRRVMVPTHLVNQELLSIMFVESTLVGALLANGWSHCGGCSNSGEGAYYSASGLWTRKFVGSDDDVDNVNEVIREAVNIDFSLSPAAATDGKIALGVRVKGGVVRISRAGAVGSVVYVLPALAPCILRTTTSDGERFLTAHDSAVLRILNLSPSASLSGTTSTPERWARVLPPSSSSRALLGAAAVHDVDDDNDDGPSSLVPFDSLCSDVMGLRTSTREKGGETSRAIIKLLCSALPGAVIVSSNDEEASTGGAGAGAGAAGLPPIQTPTLVPPPPSSAPPKFMKASALEARSSILGVKPFAAPLQPTSTPFSALLAEATLRSTNMFTVRSAGDVLRGSGGVRITSGVISMAPPSIHSASWLARTRPDAAAALLTVEGSLLLWPLTSSDITAPTSLSDLVPLNAVTAQFAHYSGRSRVTSTAATSRVIGLATSFASTPYELGIRPSSAVDVQRARRERETFDVAAGAAPLQDDGGDIGHRTSDIVDVGGGGGDEGPCDGPTTTTARGATTGTGTAAPATKPTKKQKVAAPEATLSEADAAAAAAITAQLVAAVTAVADSEEALSRESVAALKAYLKATGLAVSGAKPVLIQRVLSRPRPKAVAPPPPPPQLRLATTIIAPPIAAPAPVLAPVVIQYAQLDSDDDL